MYGSILSIYILYGLGSSKAGNSSNPRFGSTIQCIVAAYSPPHYSLAKTISHHCTYIVLLYVAFTAYTTRDSEPISLVKYPPALASTMAEPLSVASGALEVAGAGFQLATTLYVYSKGVRDAETDIDGVATEFKITSIVLENLAALLQKEDIYAHCSAAFPTDAREVMEACQKAFSELDNAIKSILVWQTPMERGAFPSRLELSGRSTRLK